MNDFENNMNDNENITNDINSEEPEIQKQPDHTKAPTTAACSNAYPPQSGSYTSSTNSSQSYGNMYSTYSSGNGYRTEYGAYSNVLKPKKKSSKVGFVAIAICGFLVFAMSFSLIGYTIAKTASLVYNNDISEADSDYRLDASNEKDEDSGDTSKKPSDTEAQNPPATINKNNSEATPVQSGKAGEPMTKSQAASLIKDSVVEITTEQVVNGNSFYQYVESGAGSGVIIAKEGYVITNNHVISEASKIVVRLTNGNEYEAELIGTDASTDIALLKINANEALTVATLGSSANLSIAEEVLVIGNPLGELGGTVTNGIVSALAREITIEGENMTLIQTNAAVNPGNSGGGMFNLYGELVGIVNAKSSGTDVEGLGFAIPIDTAYEIVLQLMDYGYVRGRVDHGLSLIDINDFFTAASYRVNSLGVYVYESKYTNDIKNGDRIASINGKEVSTSNEVKEALSGCKVGDVVEVTVARNGKFVDVELELHEYIPESSSEVSFE